MKLPATLAAVLAAAMAANLEPAHAVDSARSTGSHETTIEQGERRMTDDMRASTLEVPGASIYHEARGSGPTLLIIPGGPQDAGVFADLARDLAARYTVVTYDPRGNSRSRFKGERQEFRLDVQADDAAALIRAAGQGPAHVFGTSGGAHIGLELAARHPGLVATLVAHEPPTMMLMGDPSAEVASAKDLHQTWRDHGVEAAMGKFFADNALDGGASGEDGPPEFDMPPEAAETFNRVSGNFAYWLSDALLPLSFYEPDVAALKAGKPRIVVAIGEASAGLPIAAMSQALADRLGIAATTFPGDHMGFERDATAFADAMHAAFAAH